MDINCGIYAIKSPSGKAYIGSSKNLKNRKINHFWRLRNNKHHCPYLQKAWNKYGFLSFQVIELCDVSKLIEREQFYIDNHLEFFNGMYNLGLKAGRVDFTQEVRAKMVAAKLGKKQPAAMIENRAAQQRGRKRSPETVTKIAAANRGQKRSQETKDKIALALKGKKRSKSITFTPEGLASQRANAARAREMKRQKQNGH